MTPRDPATEEPARPEHQPTVTVRKSLASREHILSMIDGKPYKTLKRHLGRHGMTPAEYRERYGLKADYPMTAPAYSEHRRDVAKSLGLGRKPKVVEAAPPAPEPAAVPEPAAQPVKAKRVRKGAATAPAPAPAPRKRGRPAKVRPEVAEESAPQQPEPMFD